MNKKDIHFALMKACLEKTKNSEKCGEDMFNLYVTSGLPPEITLDLLRENKKIKKDEELHAIIIYQNKKMEHDVVSGISEKNKKKQQLNNLKIIEKYLTKGEI